MLAAVVLALAVRRARADLDDRTAPMAGLVTAFVFAVQMINFPILPGASGHLLGGALVAILVGPWVGTLCIAIVLVVQALLFADGGLTALGTNITNMALIGVFVGYAVALALRPLARRSRGGLLGTAFVGRVRGHRGRLARLRARVRGRRGRGHLAGHRVHADGRAARADRHRRGHHHRGHRRRGRRDPTRPGLPAARPDPFADAARRGRREGSS